jgi:hypothetical protein
MKICLELFGCIVVGFVLIGACCWAIGINEPPVTEYVQEGSLLNYVWEFITRGN